MAGPDMSQLQAAADLGNLIGSVLGVCGAWLFVVVAAKGGRMVLDAVGGSPSKVRYGGMSLDRDVYDEAMMRLDVESNGGSDLLDRDSAEALAAWKRERASRGIF